MTDRDTFAAAALTGMLEPLQAYSEKYDYPFRRRVCQMAYIWADAMLRERCEVSVTLTDEEREAVEAAILLFPTADVYHLTPPAKTVAATLRKLLERLA